jgi:hypothetical protein
MLPYAQILGFVPQLAPTWCKPQHVNFAQVIEALLERGNLALTDLARALPRPTQPLHGRLKRLGRFLDNPRLDELAVFARWFTLTYHLGADLPSVPGERPIIPLLFDTVYFNPFALLVCTVPCGNRRLPVALTTYHRQELAACFPHAPPGPAPTGIPTRRGPAARSARTPLRQPSRRPAKAPRAQPIAFLSQNQIEEELVELVFALLSPALHGVIVADRGFARASFFRFHTQRQHSYVIRFDAQTHIRLPQPMTDGRPSAGTPAEVLGISPGQRIWCPEAFYGKDDQVPIRLLAVWEATQKEPWYLASDLTDEHQIETLYRWRMRLECANRDEKTGVILREGGDQHALHSVIHLHRLLLAVCAAEWLCALTGLQAEQDLPATTTDPLLPSPPPLQTRDDLTDLARLDHGPADPPPIVPHRGPQPKPPLRLKRFVARGPLSYVRLGREVLRTPDMLPIIARLVRWLTVYLWSWTPLWHPAQLRYRLLAWWANTS